MNRSRIAKLTSLLSALGFIALVVGLTLVDQNLGNRSMSREFCRSVLILTLRVAPGLAAAGIVTGLLALGQKGPLPSRHTTRFMILDVVTLIVVGLSTGFPLWLDIRSCTPAHEPQALFCLELLHGAVAEHVALYGSLPATTEDLWTKVEWDGETLERFQKSGYQFIYAAGPPEPDGTRKRYTLEARPIQFGKTGAQNFFADETKIRRFTTEDRPATVKDCRVEEWQNCKAVKLSR